MLELPPLPPTIRSLSDPEYERLRRHYPRLWDNPHKTCLTCSKQGTFLTVQGETRCPCADQWILYLYLLNAGVLLSYQRISWDDVHAQVSAKVIEAVLEYIENSERYVNAGMGLILNGTPGTGKTLLSTLLFKRLLENGHDGYFTQFNDLLNLHISGWRNREDLDWFTRRVANAGVLVIDDIGKEYRGAIVVEDGAQKLSLANNREAIVGSMFDQVIRTRVADDKPTIITTNYTMAQMQSGYGGPVMSLLAESCFDFEVTGLDFRPQARQRQQEELRNGIVRPVTLS